MRGSSLLLVFGVSLSSVTASCPRLGHAPKTEREPTLAATPAPAPALTVEVGAPEPSPPSEEEVPAEIEAEAADLLTSPPEARAEADEELPEERDDEEPLPADAIDQALEDDDAEVAELEGSDSGDAGPELASIARESWIYAKPRHKSRKLGYLRAGAIVSRSEESVGRRGCKGGWYEIEPGGFVCIGRNATLDVHHPIVEASRVRPKRDTAPYQYVMSRFPTPPLYSRLPTLEEQQREERDLEPHLRRHAKLTKNEDYVPPPPAEAIPPALLYDQSLPGLANEKPRDPMRLVLGRANVHSGFALLSQFEHEGRRFGQTVEMAVLPLDRTRVVRASAFHGIELGEDVTLPVAFVRRKKAPSFTENERGKLTRGELYEHREALPLTGRRRSGAGGRFLEVEGGRWVREHDVVRIDPLKKAPSWSKRGRKWVDVSILKQSLVAYEGTRPVFVTLVSTGVDGVGDPKETHSTIQGAFLIHTKHVSVTMDSDEAGDEFDLRDVPFVQYFTEGYALHGAYWHDEFGTPRSHGCVNLAPRDAAWLFGWTTPEVPDEWHAALSLKKGTLVYTHP